MKLSNIKEEFFPGHRLSFMERKNSISVAFIGSGYMAREHVRAFQDIPEVMCAGVFSKTREHADSFAKELNIPEVAGSIKELYDRTRADLVIIAVPELVVNSVATEAFKYPWKILMEKPPGYNLTDAEAIVQSAKRTNSQVYVGLNRRFYSSTLFLMKQIKGKNPVYIHVQDQENQIAARENGQPETVVQNWMYANSIHMIDFLTFLNPSGIVRCTPVKRWQNEGDNTVVAASIEYADGSFGIYECIWNQPGPWSVSVTTKEMRIELRPLESAGVQYAGNRTLEPVEPDPQDIRFKPGLRLQAEEMVNIVKGQSGSVPSLDDAMVTMRLINRIYT